MACEQCGSGRRGPLPGMVCPECAAAGPSRRRSPKGALFLAAGVVAMSLVAVTVVVLLRGDGGRPTAMAVGGPGAGPGPGDGLVRAIPTRITPTEFPTEEEPEPSDPATSTAPSPTPTPSVRPPVSHPPTYESWAGPGCAGGGEYRENGRYEDGLDGWYTVTRGGYRGGGCDGSFTAMPMSGSPTEDHDNSATWTWHVAAPSTRCALAVHVPAAPRPQDAAGAPSVYQVLANGTPYAMFRIDQTAHRGRLLTTATYPLRGDTFTVRLVDRGQDWGATQREGAHHAAGQMRLTCR